MPPGLPAPEGYDMIMICFDDNGTGTKTEYYKDRDLVQTLIP